MTATSIVAVPRGGNLLTDGGFEQPRHPAWVLKLPPGATSANDPRVRFQGRQSLRISLRGSGAVDQVLLAQVTDFLPDTAAGVRYVLRARIRTAGLVGRLYTVLRLNYLGGSYSAFGGVVETAASPDHAIPSETSKTWIMMVAHARATLRLASVDALVIDSRRGSFAGTLWVDDVELRAER